MKYLLAIILLAGCAERKENAIIYHLDDGTLHKPALRTFMDIDATGHNNDGTVNIEYLSTDGEYYSMDHISVDSLLTLIRRP